MHPRALACVVTLTALLFPPGLAAAQTPAGAGGTPTTTTTPPATTPTDDPSIVEARRRYAQGAEFYRRGRYAEAVAEFTEAYSRWQNPTILFALGQAYEGLSDVNRAIETYRQYIEASPAEDPRRAEVEAKIAELERLLATVHVASNVEASIYVDGERVGAAPGDVRLATGRHEIEIRADGYVPSTQTIIVAGGTERTLSFELEQVPVATTTQIVTVESEPFRFPRPVFYAAVGATAAGAAAWGSLATATLVRANRYNDDPDRTNFQRQRARDLGRASNVALGVTGGVAAVTLVIGLLTEWDDDEEDEEEGPPAAAVSASVIPVERGALVVARWTR